VICIGDVIGVTETGGGVIGDIRSAAPRRVSSFAADRNSSLGKPAFCSARMTSKAGINLFDAAGRQPSRGSIGAIFGSSVKHAWIRRLDAKSRIKVYMDV
jgi:hypothetical protein